MTADVLASHLDFFWLVIDHRYRRKMYSRKVCA